MNDSYRRFQISSSWSSSSINTKGKKNRVLIVADDPEVTESFGLVLEDSGLFQVATFSDPMLALSNFRPDLYDVVLLDVKMPNVDSFELYDKMKKIDSKLKVYFMGIYDNEETYQALRDQFPSLEEECFMSKSVGIQDLIERVKKQFEGK
jgi:DNA-binding NtrC family response regulator